MEKQMELLDKIKSYAYYLFYYRTIKEVRQLSKDFLDKNMTTTAFCLLYCEEAVKSFYDSVILRQPNYKDSLELILDAELDKYQNLKSRMQSYKEYVRSRQRIIIYDTSPKNILKSIRTHNGIDRLINYCHKSIVSIFDDMETELHNIFKKDKE